MATAGLVILCAALVGSEVRWNWLPAVGENFALGQDPDIQAVDWWSLRPQIAVLARERPGLVVAAMRWHDCGKLNYALRNEPFLCLGENPRQFGMVQQPAAYFGHDILIAAPRSSLKAVTIALGSQFDSIEQLPPIMLLHSGHPALKIPLFLGHDFHRP